MNIDYTALNRPVTQSDIDTYKIVYGETSFTMSRSIRIAATVIVGVLLFVCLAAIIAGGGEAILVLMQLIIGIFLVLFFIQASQTKIKRRAKIYKFALTNAANYIVGVAEPQYGGIIFNNGNARSIVDAVVLADGTEIGNFMYVMGNGAKNSSEYHWGYARVKLSRRLPHMILDAKSNDIFGKISNLPNSFPKQSWSLEGDFDRYFTLYVPTGYQQDALYVLTPDVMATLVDTGRKYDIEIVDDELLIYGPALDLSLQSSLEPMLSVVNKIGAELRTQTDRYSDERIPSRAANIVAEPGRRLKKQTSVIRILIIAGVAGLILYVIVAANYSYFLPR